MATEGPGRDHEPHAHEQALKTIGEVAEIVELTPRAIRYYEELGLLTPVVRVKGVVRLFNESDIQRLREIKRLREYARFSLAELAELLDNEEVRAQLRDRFRHTADAGERVAVLRQAIELAERRLAIIERRLEQLQSVRQAELEHVERIRSMLREQGEPDAGTTSGDGK